NPAGLRLVVDPAVPVLNGSLNGSRVALNWDHQAGAAYEVQVSTNLTAWLAVGDTITNSGTLQAWAGTPLAAAGPLPRALYRVPKKPGSAVPVAAFTANPTTGVAPLSVQFTDQSTGTPVGWNWSFGDGASSTAQNPSHAYSSAGAYTASLTVRNSAGATSSTS